MDLRGQVTIVTGASSGIGAATARALVLAGAPVVLAARRVEALETLAAELRAAGGQVLPVPTDVRDGTQNAALVRRATEVFGRVDALVNNAGLGHIGWIEQLTPEAIAEQFEVNVLAAFDLTRLVLPAMQVQRRGHIVSVASVAGHLAGATYSAYASTKFALHGFNEALRREVEPWGLYASLVCPGGVATEWAQKAGIQRRSGPRTPDWLRLSADDVAHTLVAILRSDRSRHVIIPWQWRVVVWANHWFPGVVDYLNRRFVVAERGSELRRRMGTGQMGSRQMGHDP